MSQVDLQSVRGKPTTPFKDDGVRRTADLINLAEGKGAAWACSVRADFIRPVDVQHLGHAQEGHRCHNHHDNLYAALTYPLSLSRHGWTSMPEHAETMEGWLQTLNSEFKPLTEATPPILRERAQELAARVKHLRPMVIEAADAGLVSEPDRQYWLKTFSVLQQVAIGAWELAKTIDDPNLGLDRFSGGQGALAPKLSVLRLDDYPMNVLGNTYDWDGSRRRLPEHLHRYGAPAPRVDNPYANAWSST